MNTCKRRRLFVDPKVQGALLLRTAGYWLFCLLSVFMMLMCWRIFTGPTRPMGRHVSDLWFQFGPALVASLLLLPVVLFDTIRSSNRFAGPLYRLRRSMRALARGEKATPVHFRDGDFWQDFAEDYNVVLERLQANGSQPTNSTNGNEQISEEEDETSYVMFTR